MSPACFIYGHGILLHFQNVKIVWVRKLNRNKDSRHVTPITARLFKLIHVLTHWDMKLAVSSPSRRMHCLGRAGPHCDKL